MAKPRIRQFGDLDKLSRAATREFLDLAERTLKQVDRFTVALAGGSTPRRLHQMVAAAQDRDRVDWSRVYFFFGDERCVPPDHVESNYAMARETLLSALKPPEDHVFRMMGEAADPAQAADAYARQLSKCFGIAADGPPPAFDLVFLGLGADGHTASLFPHTAALDSTRWVEANVVPKLNAVRLTLTAPLLSAARNVIFLAGGKDKADALAAVLEGPANSAEYPAQLIRPENGASWFVDRSCATKLSARLDTETAEVAIPVGGLTEPK